MKNGRSNLKRLLSMIVVITMILTMLPLSAFAVDLTGDTVLYLEPNTNWLNDSARFAAYFFNGSSNKWVSMEKVDGENLYQVTVPSGTWTNVIFCRMNPNNTTNSWSNKWNQTGDLTWNGTNNCCSINDGQWDCGTNVTWSTYTPTYAVTFNGTNVTSSNAAITVKEGESYTTTLTADEGYELPETVTVTMGGIETTDYTYTDGDLTVNNVTGDLVITAEGVEKANYLYLKPNSNWLNDNARFAAYFFGNGETWVSMTDSNGDGVYEVEIPEGYSKVIFCRMNPNASANNWNNKWNQTGDLTIPTDGKNLFTVPDGSWDGATTTWSVFELTTEEPDGGEEETTNDYYLVGYINNADYNGTDYKFVDGKLTVTFANDSYVVVKDGNGDWYLCESYCTGTTATLTKGHSEKMFVPANTELTFTLVENADGTLTLSYAEAEEEEPENPGTGTCTITLHFANTQGWDSVALYSWLTGTGTTLLGGWPGTAVTKDADGFYTYSYEVASGTTVNFIFNNNGAGSQTADLSLGKVTDHVEKWIKGEQILDEAFHIVTSPVVNGTSVTFTYDNASATSVSVRGTMNDWGETAMTKNSDGLWTLTLENLEPGTYEYKFYVNGSEWITDPANSWVQNDNSAFVILDPNAKDENKVTVNIHYTRPDEDYEGWNFWIWNDNGNIKDTSKLVGDELVATLVFDDARAVQNVKVIPRLSTADNQWASQETTYTIDLSNVVSGTVDYYITAGSSSGTKKLNTDVRIGNKLSSVELDYETGKINVTVAQSVTNPQFGITDGDNPDTYTIYFQNNWLWSDINVYYWGSAGTNPGWPGVPMTKVGTYGGNDLYCAEIPVDVTGVIINGIKNDGSGNRDQTPDIKSGFSDGLCYKMAWNNGNAVETFVYDAPITITETSGSGSNYTLTVSEELDLVNLYQYKVVFEGYEYDIDYTSAYATDKFAAEYEYTGEDLGASWSKGNTTFRVWAPTAEKVVVKFYTTGSDEEAGANYLGDHVMTKDVNGTWVVSVDGDLNGVYYTYEVTRDGETIEACDPYANTTGVNGERAMVIDMMSTNPDGWWDDTNPNPITSYTDAVIYELHVRDFSIDSSSGILEDYMGKFLAFTQGGTTVPGTDISTGIDYLKSLGVTHVHLLPVYDYGSVDETKCENFNWGYDPVNYNVPEGSYSTDPYSGEVRVEEFKQMVMALHNAGISVIMDVVYNHVYDAGEYCFNQIVPGYFSRPNSNASGCGNDTASEREMVHKYIVESVLYWTEEYHIDGFRFDLVGLIDIDTINELVEEVHAIRPDAIFYGEGWNMDSTNSEEGTEMAKQGNADKTPGFAYFSDSIRNQLAGSNGNSLGFVSGGGLGNLIAYYLAKPESWGETWTSDPQQVIQYASCHDNYTLIDKLILSTGAIGITDDIISMNNLTAAIYMTAQGVPFIHAGEEMLREKLEEDGGRCENSYNATDFVNSIKWDKLELEEYADTVAYYQGLIAFRKAHAALRMTDSADVAKYIQSAKVGANTVAFFIDGSGSGDDDIVIIFNADSDAVAVDIPEGVWNVCVDNEDSGTDTLYTAQTTVQVAGISAMILTQADTGENGEQTGGSDSSSADTITLYFSNNKYWDNVYAHYWGGSSASNWPGVEMTYVETNGYGEEIYSVTIPANSTGVLFHNNSGAQTADLTPGTSGTGYYCATESGGKWECGTYTYSASGGSTGSSGFVNDGVYEGSSQYFLFGWINGEDYACEGCAEAMGKYQFVDGKLTVKFDNDSYVGVKTTDNAAWYMTDGWLGSFTSATLYNSETLGSDANKLMIPGGVEVTLTLTENEDGTLKLSYEVVDSKEVEDETGIQNGVTLHCWNWSFAEIEANMALIAEMGFTAIQTSPVQPIKEATTDETDTVDGCWWLYYQPVDFTITDGEGNALGTKAELESMIETAHRYGIQVIVDVVANHLANETGNDLSNAIPESLQNPNYWHNITINIADYTSRYQETQLCMGGLPDLNTANVEVQAMVLDFLMECIDIGVDGFRFDAAKHIETDSDEVAYESDFWKFVLGSAEGYAEETYGKDIYVYGEVLDSTEGYAISDYTKYMSVTDNSWGNTLRENIANAVAALVPGYDKAAAAELLVIWAESHDTYANGSSADETVDEINKTWALVAARADAMGLYLARPERDSQLLGVASVTGWYTEEVAAVNKFHNAFVGQSEVVSNEDGISYVIRGTSGAVLVNVNGNATVELAAHGMTDGTYVDQLTGNVFTVAGGVITGTIGETGIAVVYNTYDVTITESEDGTVTADKQTAMEGETVTLTVTPNEGKLVDKVVITDADGYSVNVTDNGDGTYSFTQPAADVTVIVTFKDVPVDDPVDDPEDDPKDDPEESKPEESDPEESKPEESKPEKDEPTEEEPAEKPEDEENPKTGDSLWAIVLAMLSGAAALPATKRRNRK